MRRLLLGLVIAAAAWSQPLQLDCSQGQTVLFSSASTRYNLNFTAQTGEAVLIRFTPVTFSQGFFLQVPLLVDQFGNRVSPRSPDSAPIDLIGTASGRIAYHFDLPADGIYTLQIASGNVDATATMRISLTRINRPCTNATLICGRSAAGAIPASNAGKMDTFQYQARVGDVISFRLLRVPSGGPVDTSTGFYMAVYGPDSTVINAVNTNRLPLYPISGRTDVTATANGPLTVVIWEATANKGGAYYVSGVKLNGGCGGAALTCSSALDGQITSPLSFNSYVINAAAGDSYQLRVGRADTSGSFAVAAEVYDAAGARVGLIQPATTGGHAAASGTVRFAQGGVYSVLVSGSTDGVSGNYSIASTRINRPCTDTTIACSAILDDSLSGVVRNRVYALTASAGDTFLLRLLQPDPRSLFRPRLDIVDAAGTQLQFLASTDLSRVNFTAPADGTYTLMVADTYDNGQPGNYSLSVTRLNRPCNATSLSCGGVVSGTLSRSLAAGVYTWDAAASESFSVRMVGGTGGVLPSIEVYDPQGAQTGTAFGGASGVDVFKPGAGTYTVVALDNNRTPTAGSYSMELLRTRNACATALPQAQTASGVISSTAPFTSYTLSAAAGDTLMLRSASSTNGFSAQMELYDPEGARLDSGVFSLTRGLTAAGTYTVIVGAAASRTAGGFAFNWQLLNKPAGATPLVCGGTLSGSLAGTNQFRYYATSLDAGDTIRLLFTKVDNFTPQMELYGPNGVRITANSDVLQKVSAAGSYLVMVSPSTTAAETGSYALAFQRPNNPCSATSLTCGQTALKQVLSPGQMDTFSFNATGGDLHTIRLTARSGNYSPVAELYNSAGVRLSSSTTGQIRLVLPADGAYSLLVRDRSALSLGSYRVNLQDDTSTCSVDDREKPVITLVRPSGGEVLSGGTTFRIQWVSDDNVGVTSHDLALSTDGGKTFATPISNGVSGSAQTYDWILPGDVAPSRNAVVRITATDGAGNAQSATSDLLTLIGSGFTPNASATYQYDALNRLIQAALSDGRTITWQWDAAGNLVQVSVSGQ